MKHLRKTILVLVAVIGLTSSAIKAQTDNKINSPGNEFSFVSQNINLGTLYKNKAAKTKFIFQNKGKAPLIISNVKPTCGCTTANYTQYPVKPGKKGFIEIQYDASTLGPFNKTITVSTTSGITKLLTIYGEVLK